MDRAAVVIEHPQRQHRTARSVGDQLALPRQQFDPCRGGGVEHRPGQPGHFAALVVTDDRSQLGLLAVQRNAAPDRYGIGSAGSCPDPVITKLVGGLAANEQVNGLPGAVAQHHADCWSARVVIDGWKQEFGRTVTLGQPVSIGAGRSALRLVAGLGIRWRDFAATFDTVKGDFICLLTGFYNRTLKQSSREISHYQGATLPADKARCSAASAAGRAGAIGENAAFRQGLRLDLHDVGARGHTVEVITAVEIRDRETTVFHHDPHARNTVMWRIDAATAVGNPADYGGAGGQIVAFDPQGRPGCGRKPARIGGNGAVDRLPGRRIGADGHRISDRAAVPSGDCAQLQRQGPAIGGCLNRAGGRDPVDPHGIAAQPQQR